MIKTAINQIFDRSQYCFNKQIHNFSYINGIGQISHSILPYLWLHCVVFLVNSRGLRFCATLFFIRYLLSSNFWGELAEFLNNF